MQENSCAVPEQEVLPPKKRRKRTRKRGRVYCALSIIILSKENYLLKYKPPKLNDEYLYESLFGHVFSPKGGEGIGS